LVDASHEHATSNLARSKSRAVRLLNLIQEQKKRAWRQLTKHHQISRGPSICMQISQKWCISQKIKKTLCAPSSHLTCPLNLISSPILILNSHAQGSQVGALPLRHRAGSVLAYRATLGVRSEVLDPVGALSEILLHTLVAEKQLLVAEERLVT